MHETLADKHRAGAEPAARTNKEALYHALEELGKHFNRLSPPTPHFHPPCPQLLTQTFQGEKESIALLGRIRRFLRITSVYLFFDLFHQRRSGELSVFTPPPHPPLTALHLQRQDDELRRNSSGPLPRRGRPSEVTPRLRRSAPPPLGICLRLWQEG